MILIRAGCETLAEKVYGERVMESTRHVRARSMADICAMACTLDGVETAAMNTSELIRAGFSTTSLPNALGNTMGRTLFESYRLSVATWRSFCQVNPAADFKSQLGIRPSIVGQLDPYPNGGEVHTDRLAEATFPWSIGTFAKMIGVTRQDVINDNLGFVNQIPVLFGKGAARGVSDLVWSTIMANAASFFGSGNANLLTSGSALSITALGTAIQHMRSQRDESGNDLDIVPQVLAVPSGIGSGRKGAHQQRFDCRGQFDGCPAQRQFAEEHYQAGS